MAENLQVGERVEVVKVGMASFEAHGHFKNPAKRTGWVDKIPPPWYPHGEQATIVEEKEKTYYKVQTDDGKTWPCWIGFWCLTRVSNEQLGQPLR